MKLGDKVKDELTGFEGVLTAECNYLHDAKQCQVTGIVLDSDGLPRERWFHATRLVLANK